MNKFNGAYILEIIWLIVSGIAIAIGLRVTLEKGIEESYPLFLISAVSLLMYTFKRYMRKQKSKVNWQNITYIYLLH